jgi:hypothetical protein
VYRPAYRRSLTYQSTVSGDAGEGVVVSPVDLAGIGVHDLRPQPGGDDRGQPVLHGRQLGDAAVPVERLLDLHVGGFGRGVGAVGEAA